MNFYSILGILPLGMRYWIFFFNNLLLLFMDGHLVNGVSCFINHRFFRVADPEPQKKWLLDRNPVDVVFTISVDGRDSPAGNPPVITMKPYGTNGRKISSRPQRVVWDFLNHQQSVILLNLLRFLGWKVEHRRESPPVFFFPKR